MKILLSNDDGIHAEGINTLFDFLSGKFEVYMFAPSVERSACSNALTIRNEFKVEKMSSNKYSVSGFPADCVNVGIHSGLIPDVDLVISGINHGPNMGGDIYYSGTVAAARTAYICGKTGIAVSLNSVSDFSYLESAAKFMLDYVNQEKNYLLKEHLFLNINYPAVNECDVQGIMHTFLGKRFYMDHYAVKEEKPGVMQVCLDGTLESAEIEGSDITETEKGYVSITPLMLDTTDYKRFEILKEYKNVC